MKGIIVLEGSEGTGKSTLAKELVKRFDGRYIHCTYRWPDKMFTYHLAALHRAVKLSTKQLVILDRHWISELIYGSIFRNGSKWPESGRMFDRILKRFGALYIVCTSNPQKYAEIFNKIKNERDELYKDTEKIARVNMSYLKFLYGDPSVTVSDYVTLITKNNGFLCHDNVLTYDIEVEGKRMPEFLSYICDRMNTSRLTIPSFALDSNIYNLLGNPARSTIVFVGDRINKEKRQIDYPWMAHKNSSLFFAKCLTELGYDESRFCYVNRGDRYGEKIIREVLAHSGCRPIYLGNNSYSPVMRGPVIYHPSYALRFGFKKEFKHQLQNALKHPELFE